MILFIGWCGTLIYLANHAYISLVGKWQPKIYFGANLIAATALTVQSVHLSSWQAATINGFWMLISILLLVGAKMNSIKITAKTYYCLSTLFVVAVILYLFLFDIAMIYAALGWISAYFFCSSYFLFSAKIISSRTYLILNVFAAIGLLPHLWINQNYPVFTLEVAWASLSIIGIVKSYNRVHLID